ncbi:uncharacterized protein F4807DRAFT_376848 [Annulohypoxylon truncatum]|uniref:uncharacterized protein n=1 Tax=Annulohypoxylon truncatum TaxID=327061 RepID=UPI002008D46D|nr:uncharacterized protein F4807DRAFT_376848 [Annulohypoxylon truncatum]KAI1211804.1 hypothetical protein F4807DRAFT_376848 [Annulohypoxylon truncatum]
MPNRYCPLCDVLIDVWINPGDGLASPEYPVSWLQEVRAVRTTEGLKFPFVTGVGWLESDECIIAPIAYECHYRDCGPQQQLDDYFTGHQISYYAEGTAGYWCYAVHNACWELLRDRIDPDHDFSPDKLAQHLFALLYNTPVNHANKALVPGHDYGHASDFHLRSGELYHNYFTRLKESDYFFITGDVAEKFEPDDDGLEDGALSLYVGSAHLGTHRGNYGESDALCLLPGELIMLVLACLPSKDVCKLRLISRYVADLSSPMLLDQKFWSSRFDPEFEMGFVFAGLSKPRPIEPANWRTLYFKAKAALRSEMFYGLKNRRRIWHIFQHIYDALHVRLENEQWIDKDLPSITARPLPQGMVFAEARFESINPRIPHTMLPLDLSCRLFGWRNFTWPRSLDSVSKTLRVSTINLNGKTHISGFRLLTTGGLDNVDELPRVAFVNPRKEHEILMGPNSSIEQLDVAMATKGIIGLRFHIRGLEDSCTTSIGDMELTDPGSGIAKLVPSDGMRCIGFHLGLDACKIISISFIEQAAQALSNSIEKYSDQAFKNAEPLEVWNPNIPTISPVWYLPDASPTQYFKLCLNMDFGGPDGRLLQSLVRVDVLMGRYPSVFLGICFIYGDGSERLYGRKSFRSSFEYIVSTPAIRQSFFINGPRGELITQIVLSRYPDEDTIQAITVSTNLDRTNQFRLYGRDSTGPFKGREVLQVLQPEPGMHFTSLYAKVQSPLGHFRDLSTYSQVVSMKLQEPIFEPSGVPHHIPITVDIQKLAEDILAYPRGFAFTAADLSGLKKIRVSVNDEEHTGVQGHISGLWLEYHDSNVPVILGQWIKELDSLDLSLGERVTEVVTWHDYTNQHRRVKYGPIKRLRIGTIRGNSKEFLDSHRGGKIRLQYRENPYEKLSGILWGCNYEWDHVRIFHSPRTNGLAALSLAYSDGHSCPPWAVMQKIFMREIHENGRPNPVTTIEVTFKEIANEISGVTFIYENGRQITLGIRGTDGSEMSLSSDEKLAQLELEGNREHHIISMALLTTSGRRMDFSKQKSDIVKRTVQRTIYTLDQSCPNQPSVLGGNYHPIPKGAGSFTGFWALPRRLGSLRYGRFGPIFEKVSGEGLAG